MKLLICPEKPLEISRICHDPETMQRIYDIGRRTAESKLDAIRRFLIHVKQLEDWKLW